MSQCLTCRFYDRRGQRAAESRGLQWGLCRRDAPQLNTANAKAHGIEGVWATVRDDDWCGQWEAQRGPEIVSPSAAVLAQGAKSAGGAPRTAAMAGPRTQTLPQGPRVAGPAGVARAVPMHGPITSAYKPNGGKTK